MPLGSHSGSVETDRAAKGWVGARKRLVNLRGKTPIFPAREVDFPSSDFPPARIGMTIYPDCQQRRPALEVKRDLIEFARTAQGRHRRDPNGLAAKIGEFRQAERLRGQINDRRRFDAGPLPGLLFIALGQLFCRRSHRRHLKGGQQGEQPDQKASAGSAIRLSALDSSLRRCELLSGKIRSA